MALGRHRGVRNTAHPDHRLTDEGADGLPRQHLSVAHGRGGTAGTADYHVGKPPDRRMTEAARQAGLGLGGSARQVETADFHRFDIILAMDRSNLADLQAIAPSPELAAKVRLFRSFDATATDLDVPDPYYEGDEGFREVVAICRRAAAGFVDRMAGDAP